MNMSKAAIAPRQPHVSERDRKHPLFPTYNAYRASMACQLVQAEAFGDWLGCYERKLRDDAITKHARFPEFQQWMRETRGGARACPAGSFPHNFLYWLEGGRW